MPRKARAASSSGVYHVMLRGIDKMQIFEDDYDCLRFLQIVDTVPADKFEILAFCLMGNHVHLLVKVPHGEDGMKILESAMKSINIRYSSHFNRRFYRFGALFGGRFASIPVETKSYLCRVVRYIHDNPCVAGIADNMADYRFTSYHDYFDDNCKPLCRVNTGYVYSIVERQKLLAFHKAKETKFDDFGDSDTVTKFLNDSDATKAICDITGCNIPSDISRMPQKLRDVAVDMICDLPLSIRQLSRLSGISRGIITRVRNSKKQ